jgi:hypothetical protein
MMLFIIMPFLLYLYVYVLYIYNMPCATFVFYLQESYFLLYSIVLSLYL